MSENVKEDANPPLDEDNGLVATEETPRMQSTGSLMGEHILSAEGSRTPPIESAPPVLSPPSTDSEVGMSLEPPPITDHQNHSGGFVEAMNSSVPSRVRWLPRPIAMRNSSGGASRNPDYHRRLRSTGDQSLLSALTDPDSVEQSEPEPASSRSSHPPTFTEQVSFGSNNSESSILQPDLSDLMEDVRTTEMVTPSDPVKKITLNDLVTANPLETEAETAILEAIEKQQATPVARGGASNRILLPGVPDDAVHFFQSDDQDQHQFDCPSIDRNKSDQLNSATEGPEKSRPRLNTSSSNRNPRKPGHRRSQTLPTLPMSLTTEEKLVGLAAQMKEVHQNNAFHAATENTIREETVPLVAREEDPLAANPGSPSNATDVLVQNANILFRQQVVGCRRVVSQGDGDEDSETEEDAEAGGTGNRGEPKKRLFFFGEGSSKSRKPVEDTADAANGLEIKTGGDEDQAGPADVAKRQSAPLMRTVQKAQLLAVAEYQFARDFLKPRTANFWKFCAKLILCLWVPVLAASFILYYVGNPLTCNSETADEQPKCASFSWWLIFLLIRQVITLCLAKLWEVLIIDFLALKRRTILRLSGPIVTLFIVQSKGWPFLLFVWGLMDFSLLYGGGRFANHWLFWQDLIPVFNESNPAGEVTRDEWYRNILLCALIVGATVAVKRLWMGVHLGKRTYANFSKQLTKVMNEMLLISLVANFGRELEVVSQGFDLSQETRRVTLISWDNFEAGADDETTIDGEAGAGSPAWSDRKTLSSDKTPPRRPRAQSQMSPDVASSGYSDGGSPAGSKASPRFFHENAPPAPSNTCEMPAPHKIATSLTVSQRTFVSQQLGQWEEPERESESDALRNISIGAILQFRQALAYMDDLYPFSPAFGPAGTREQCIESAQKLYDRLLLQTPDRNILSFDTIAVVATNKNGELDPKRLKRLVRLFRPDRAGNLTMLDFVKSCDKVYKTLRLLRASVANSSQIDCAFEHIVNVGFYIILGAIVLSMLGFDPIALFLSLSGLVVSFAFMIGSATSSYFSGILFILCQRPYNIGDRINVSDPETDTSSNGSPGWIVESVNLYSTTARFGTTNEVATLSNGSLAKSRIINAARSPQATVYVHLKFGIDVPYKKVQVFQKTVESFVKARPREWRQIIAFRATRVEADHGFIEYVIVVQHVEAWQNIGGILQSKADLSSYCLEISKKLEMRYVAPPLPVNLDIAGKDTEDLLAATEVFEQQRNAR